VAITSAVYYLGDDFRLTVNASYSGETVLNDGSTHRSIIEGRNQVKLIERKLT
jgi:hypothetical protein